MDIHIQLAGIELGPYSEQQVREYMTEGLLSSTDPARLDGTDAWGPVGELLAKLPPAEVAPIVPVQAVEPKETPTPVELPVAPPPVASLPPQVVPESPKTELVMTPKTESEPTSSERTSQGLPLLVKGFGKKSVPATKIHGSDSTPSGLGEKIIASPVKILARKKGPETKPAATVPTPTSAPTPIAPPASPTTSLPVRVMVKKKSPDSKTAVPPSAVPETPPAPALPVATAKPAEPTGKLPSVVRALVKKVEPGAKSPDAAPWPPVNPVSPTSPAPVVPVKPVETSAPGPIKVLSKKNNQQKQVTSRIQLASPAPTAPAPVVKAKVEEPTPAPVVVSTPPPAEPKSLPVVPVEKVAIVKPRTPKRRIPSWGKYAVMGVIGLIVLYVCLPYYAAHALWRALNNGKESALDSVIDFPALRDSMKAQLGMQLPATDTATGAKSSPDSPAATIRTMIENSIDLYVTPAGIASLANKADAFADRDQAKTVSPQVAMSLLLALNSQQVKSQGFDSMVDFVIDLETARLHLQFYGLGWKLDRLELKSGFQMPPLTQMSAPSVSPDAALVSPVIETYLNQGNEKCQKGDWAGAIADFTQVLTINPKAAVAYNNRGFARQSKGDIDAAIADYTQAIDIDPKLSGVYFGRGTAKMIKGDIDGALADLTQAINNDPKLEGAYFSRGNGRTTKGDYDGAIGDYSEVVNLDPNQAIAYSNRGFARQAKNDLDGAVTDYTQALAIDPKIAIAYYNRGLARQAQGNVDGAILDFNQSLDLDPKMAGAYYNRGNAKNTKHDLDGAIADYNLALKLDPKIALAYCNRGLARQTKGDLEEAIADYTQALNIDPKIAVAYYNRGLIKEQRDDLDGAIADSSRALDLDPTEAQAYYNRGFAKLTKGNLEGARTDLGKFCELAPRDHFSDHARLYLWLISKAQNPRLDASQALSDSLQSDWNSPPEDLSSKIAAFLLDRMSESDLIAAAASSDVKKDQGQHCEVWYFAGMKRLLAGDKAMAIEYFHKCLATEKKDFCEYILAKAELQSLDPAPVAPSPTGKK